MCLDLAELCTLLHCPGRILGIMGKNPSVSKPNQLHVVSSVFLYSFEVYFIDSSKKICNFREDLQFSTCYFSNSTNSFVSCGQFFPFIQLVCAISLSLRIGHLFTHPLTLGEN
jgi:hypothetical protein